MQINSIVDYLDILPENILIDFAAEDFLLLINQPSSNAYITKERKTKNGFDYVELKISEYDYFTKVEEEKTLEFYEFGISYSNTKIDLRNESESVWHEPSEYKNKKSFFSYKENDFKEYNEPVDNLNKSYRRAIFQILPIEFKDNYKNQCIKYETAAVKADTKKKIEQEIKRQNEINKSIVNSFQN